ncbi:MAG TPA: PH domain-containing protein [Oligoflexia bacterium]|nr:PH domain-containing protein [Oligoflexia bacterium]HMP27875.1 PH domain-containing protein [Oligoflexia bacterium]
MIKYPTLDELLAESKDGTFQIELHRSFVSLLSLMLKALLSGIFACLINYWAFASDSSFGHSLPISLRWLALIPTYFILEMLRQRFNELYIFNQERVVQKSGILSINYRSPTAKYSDIRSLICHQSLLGRALNYGDIQIGTAAQDDNEIIIKGVYNPKGLLAFISELRARCLELEGISVADHRATTMRTGE